MEQSNQALSESTENNAEHTYLEGDNIKQDSSPQDFKEVAHKIMNVIADDEGSPNYNSLKSIGIKTSAFELAIDSVGRHLGDEEAESIKNQLEEIDKINTETIGTIRESGNLSKETELLTRRLSLYGVNSDNLTEKEVKSVYDYANNATDEVVIKKTNRIYDSIVLPIERSRINRTLDLKADHDKSKYTRIANIQERFIDWQNGKLDTERGFDVDEAYNRLLDEGYEPSNALRRHLEEDYLEDLLEEGLIDDSSIYQYGPFTRSDIELAEKNLESSWESVVNRRLAGLRKKVGKKRTETMATIGRYQSPEIERQGANLNNLISNTVSNSTSNIEQDLVREYVAGEILQSRRLKVREMLMASASLCLDVIDLDKPSSDDSLEKLEYDEARTAASHIAYYSSKILNIDSKELRDRFGSNRPIRKELFEEILQSASQMPEGRAKYLDKEFNQILTKMDEHIHDIIERLSALASGESPLFSEELD